MQRTIRLEITELEEMLKDLGTINQGEHLHDAHIEPGELVITVLSEDGKEEGESVQRQAG